MDKPISLVMEEFKQNMINTINKSGLHVSIIDTLLAQIYNEVHNTALQVAQREQSEYEAAKDKKEKDSD